VRRFSCEYHLVNSVKDLLTLDRPAAKSAAPAPAPETFFEALRSHVPDLIRVLLVNSAIGGVVSVVFDYGLVDSQLYSHAIGLAIFVLAVVLSHWFGATRAHGKALLIAVPLGCVVGLLLGAWLTGDGLLGEVYHLHIKALASLAFPLMTGTGVAYYFYSRGLLAERDAQLKEAELTRAVERQRASEAQLKMLQAQIEPHFLFNTLSNVISLIDERPQSAKDMLVDLTRLLRRSLLRARADTLPLAEEIADIRAYLEIQAQRLGPRLHYTIEVDPALAALQIAPYLLQPLVENAIRHGLEPMIDGGQVRIRVQRQGEQVRIEVADTGGGLRTDREPGLALANIRERLQALYGAQAQLSLHPNTPTGVLSRLSFPMSRS
jgi:signal transduction histidine kinase